MTHRLIHGLWHDGCPPSRDDYSRTWRAYNPEATVRIWSFGEVEAFLPEYPLLAQHYPLMRHVGQVSDILRFILMDKYGGIYLDLDIECLRPLDGLFEEEIFFSFAPPPFLNVSNAVFGCKRPGHPIWRSLITGFSRSFVRPRDSVHAVNASGSLLLAHHVQKHLLLAKCKSPEILLPFTDEQRNSALTVHHSRRTWMNKERKMQ